MDIEGALHISHHKRRITTAHQPQRLVVIWYRDLDTSISSGEPKTDLAVSSSANRVGGEGKQALPHKIKSAPGLENSTFISDSLKEFFCVTVAGSVKPFIKRA